MTWIKFFEFLAGRLHHVAIDYLGYDRCRFTDNLQLRHYTTLHVEIGEISADNWQGAGFGGPLVMTLQTNPMFEGP